MEGRAFIFLNGFYPRGDQRLVRRLIRKLKRRPVMIAVDGGIAFLQKASIRPDCWISDLDSAPRLKRGFLRDIEVFLYPADKDKTDGELAIELCARRDLSDITIFGWDARKGETDHLLGSLFLCRNLKGKKRGLRLRFLDSRQEILPLKNEKRIIRDCKGKRLSVIPLSSNIILGLAGTRYPARNLAVSEGETISLRNLITANRAAISIQGTGLAIIS
jgi:thiamine pyrophosphokinase